MTLIEGKDYVCDTSDLLARVHKIHFQNEEYAEVKISLYSKYNGLLYETKNYKLVKERIKHWKLA